MKIENYYLNFLFLIVGSLLSWETNLSAQKTITLNFKDKSISLDRLQELDKLEEGDSYTIEIDEINTFLYKVIIETKDTIIEDSVTFPTFANLGFDSLTDIFSKIGPLSTSITETITQIKKTESTPDQDSEQLSVPSNSRYAKILGEEEEIQELIANKILALQDRYNFCIKLIDNHDYWKVQKFNIEELMDSIPKINEISELVNAVRKQIENYDKKLPFYEKRSFKNDLRKRDNRLLSKYEALIKDLEDLKSRVSDQKKLEMLRFVTNKRIDYEAELLQEYQDTFDYAILRIGNMTTFVDTIEGLTYFDDVDRTIQNLTSQGVRDTIRKYLGEIKSTLQYLSKESIQSKKEYENEIDRFKRRKVFEKQKKLTDLDSKIKTAYQSLSEVIKSAREKIGGEKIKQMLITLGNIIRNKGYKYKSFPIQLNGDQTKLVVKMVPKDSNMGLQSYTYGPIKFPRYKYNTVGVGTSFYISGLYDEVYSSITTINDTTITIMGEESTIVDTTFNISKEDFSKLELGMFANFNFWKDFGTRNEWSVGITIGPGVSFTQTIRPRLLGGLSIGYGKRNRIVAGVGGIAGYVDKLSKTLINDSCDNEENCIKTDLPALPNNIVVSKLETSWFFHFGYIHRFSSK